MMAYDHPLNSEGINQASTLNREWKEAAAATEAVSKNFSAFLSADVIFSSPLTRATETCILALQGHPTYQATPIKLLSSCREIKGIGGLDTVGIRKGAETEANIRNVLGDMADTLHISIDPYDTYSEWWTSTSEKKNHLKKRIMDFFCTLRYTECERGIIVVAHSLFFRRILRDFLSPEEARRHPKLQKNIMQNASCLFLNFNFGHGKVSITEADFLFGGLEKTHEREVD